jgi:DNA segregation ATPase FtsK/SpoIIIE, S-DNA-T family
VTAVGRWRTSIERAATLHRQAAAIVEVAEQALDGYAPEPTPPHEHAEQHELAAALQALAAELAPGWLGAPLDAFPPGAHLPAPGTGTQLPRYVRLGLAQPRDDDGVRFPVVVPLLGVGNLAIDADVRDARAAGLLTSVLLRLVAATPAGALRIRPVDATGTLFTPFRALMSANLMTPPVADRESLRAVLSEAEDWVREPGWETLLLVIASLPELADAADLARIATLAEAGPASRLHLIVAGWPPPPVTEDLAQRPLALTTQVTLRNPYAIVGDPPGGTFGTTKALNSPVYLDACPPLDSVRQVCAQLSAHVTTSGSTLTELLPSKLWRESSAEGLAAMVGLAGDNRVTLYLSELTPHWLVGGTPGTHRDAFLTNVLYGLSTRYAPTELALYLLDLKDVETASQYALLPHVRAVALHPDREYCLAVFQELDQELARRIEACEQAGAARFADLKAEAQNEMPRIVCLVDGFDTLVRSTNPIARRTLDSLARKGRAYGIHLILAAADLRGFESLYAKRDSPLGQFPVRVALAGGSAVLDRSNQAATALRPGEAIVNTAGGLGGPQGASRAHERLITFPDPLSDPTALTALRHRLWEARPAQVGPPQVFNGRVPHRLPESIPPTAPTAPPVVYIGRTIDFHLSLAGFALGHEPGRHLAVLGPSEAGADILESAARSLTAQHTPGTVEFVLASFNAGQASVARSADQALRAIGHRSRMVDSLGFKEVVSDPALTHTYILGFGLDGAPDVGLGPLLLDGPARGVHLIGWWRGLRRFREESNGTPVGLVILNLPAAEAAMLVGEAAADWQPRPNRALLHDPADGRTSLIQPFVQSGQSR